MNPGTAILLYAFSLGVAAGGVAFWIVTTGGARLEEALAQLDDDEDIAAELDDDLTAIAAALQDGRVDVDPRDVPGLIAACDLSQWELESGGAA